MNRRARYMHSRQYPPLPTERPHLIEDCRQRHGHRCWVRCQCGALMYAKSPDALCTRWRDHRAASGLRTPALSEAVG